MERCELLYKWRIADRIDNSGKHNKNEEILYKVTEISTQYLEKEDVEKLIIGVEVKGLQELNQLLEDFE